MSVSASASASASVSVSVPVSVSVYVWQLFANGVAKEIRDMRKAARVQVPPHAAHCDSRHPREAVTP